MRIHKEGYFIILGALIFLDIINIGLFFYAPRMVFWVFAIISFVLFVLIVQFFRNPIREISNQDDSIIYAPADGKIVVIEEAFEDEYFKQKRIQLSIFMSPLNVHVNRNPISGVISYVKYHAGRYLVAWHPKSSTENERTTIVINNGKEEVLMRQIAGALARRIVCYAEKNQEVIQGEDVGFIKFGSRVDVFLPLDADIQVAIGDKSIGNKTILAKLKK